MNEFQDRARLILVSVAACVVLMLTACASAPPPPSAALNEARLAIEVAERVDAGHSAGPELDEARQMLLAAEKAVVAKNMVQAERYATQSTVMAELATARTETTKALAVNDELNRGAKALLEEMQRNGEQQ